MLDKRNPKPAMPKKKSKYDSFKTRMKILASMIEASQPLTPTQISHATGITHFPTISYHMKCLVKEGVAVPLDRGRNEYALQPFMVKRHIDRSISALKVDVEELKAKLTMEIEEKNRSLQTLANSLSAENSELRGRVQELEGRLGEIKLLLTENQKAIERQAQTVQALVVERQKLSS